VRAEVGLYLCHIASVIKQEARKGEAGQATERWKDYEKERKREKVIGGYYQMTGTDRAVSHSNWN